MSEHKQDDYDDHQTDNNFLQDYPFNEEPSE
eukprot:CAMPEP_0194032598 /NCGR_PEP_ID=MMETSP0009_2-20130614/5506_1 /TAXON_ID=210454 /ORGANISM="Grammatophora oceanica, Strain CCMP 410" /LENGTH=30 /DNA_ID= /DNA_START= /DNA_END= /DNA_ORIENTATION=